MVASKLTEAQRSEVLKLAQAGIPQRRIAQQFGVTQPTIDRIVSPPVIGMNRTDGVPAAEVAARRAEIPADTRSLTARVFGDPLPGRSALDQRSEGA